MSVVPGTPITVEADDMYDQHYTPYENPVPDMNDCHCECPDHKYINVEVPKTQIQYYPIEEHEIEGYKQNEDKYDSSSMKHGIDSSVFQPPHTEDAPPDDSNKPFKADISQKLYQELEGLVEKISSNLPGHYSKKSEEYKDDRGKHKPMYHPQPGYPSKHEEDDHQDDAEEKDRYDKFSGDISGYKSAEEGEDNAKHDGEQDHNSYQGKDTHDDKNSRVGYNLEPKTQYDVSSMPGAKFDDDTYGSLASQAPHLANQGYSIPYDGIEGDASSKASIKGRPPSAFLHKKFLPKKLTPKKQSPSVEKKEGKIPQENQAKSLTKKGKNSYVLVIKKTTQVPRTQTKQVKFASSSKKKTVETDYDQLPLPTNLPPTLSTLLPTDMSWFKEKLRSIADPHEDLRNNIRKSGKVKRVSLMVANNKPFDEEPYYVSSSDQIKTYEKKKPKKDSKTVKKQIKDRKTKRKDSKTTKEQDVSEVLSYEEEEEEEEYEDDDDDYQFQGEVDYNDYIKKENEKKLKTQKKRNEQEEEGEVGKTEDAINSVTKRDEDVISRSTLKPSITGKLVDSDVIRVSETTLGDFLVANAPKKYPQHPSPEEGLNDKETHNLVGNSFETQPSFNSEFYL